jgi:hypothetical protein
MLLFPDFSVRLSIIVTTRGDGVKSETSRTLFPFRRVPMAVKHCGHVYLIFVKNIANDIGLQRQTHLSRSSLDDCIGQRIGCNSVKCNFEFISKLLTQTGLLFLKPIFGFANILFRDLFNNDRIHNHSPKISFLTDSQGSPLFGFFSNSTSRRRISSCIASERVNCPERTSRSRTALAIAYCSSAGSDSIEFIISLCVTGVSF